MTARMFSASLPEPLGPQVDIAGGAASTEGGQEHPAFQDELVGEPGLGQASEKGDRRGPWAAGRGRPDLPWWPEKEQSQEDLQGLAQRGLGLGKLTCELDQLGRAPAWAIEPAPQRLPGDLAAFEVAEADDVDEGPLG